MLKQFAKVSPARAAPSPVELSRKLRAGLSFQHFLRLQKSLQIPAEELTALLRISPRTLARRKREGRFNLDESERIDRLDSIFRQAVELFAGDADGARRWLETPRPVFDNKSALEFAQTGVGAREVEDMIERIAYGVFY